jgi:hypothetical protein
MAESYEQERALARDRQSTVFGRSDQGTTIRHGRVLRAGGFEVTDTAAFYDVVLLNDRFGDINMNSPIAFSGTVKPVYPYIANVACPIGNDPEIGAIVSMTIRPGMSATAHAYNYEVLDDEDYDISQRGYEATMLSGVGGGSGSCSGDLAGMVYDS